MRSPRPAKSRLCHISQVLRTLATPSHEVCAASGECAPIIAQYLSKGGLRGSNRMHTGRAGCSKRLWHVPYVCARCCAGLWNGRQNRLVLHGDWAYSRLTGKQLTRGAPKVMFRRAGLPLYCARHDSETLAKHISQPDFPQKAVRLADFQPDSPVLRVFWRDLPYFRIIMILFLLIPARFTVRNGQRIL